jgi:vacuolar-type H+-ATPase subunit H
MKKLFTILVVGSIFTTATFAQAKPTAAVKQEAKKDMKKAEVKADAKVATAKVEAKKDVKKAEIKADAKVATAKVEAKSDVKKAEVKADAKVAAPKMKKDGTPDMRLKENKETKADVKAPKKG